MEHAILIAIINKITPILDQHDMLLDICVDGDLDSNKTLRGERQVNKVFGDLKHITKNIRKKIGEKLIYFQLLKYIIYIYTYIYI
jgi:hypothetical protein